MQGDNHGPEKPRPRDLLFGRLLVWIRLVESRHPTLWGTVFLLVVFITFIYQINNDKRLNARILYVCMCIIFIYYR